MVQFAVAYLNQLRGHGCRPSWQDSLKTPRSCDAQSSPISRESLQRKTVFSPSVKGYDPFCNLSGNWRETFWWKQKQLEDSAHRMEKTDSLGVCRCWEGQRKPVWSEGQEANYSFIFVLCCQTRALFGVTVTAGMYWSKTIARGTCITIVFLGHCKVVGVWQWLNRVGNSIFHHFVFALVPLFLVYEIMLWDCCQGSEVSDKCYLKRGLAACSNEERYYEEYKI